MKLIDQLPPRIRPIKEIADFQEAVQPIIDQFDIDCEQLLINKNPLYANLDGVLQWEEWLRIIPDPNKTLEQRRLDIVAKLNERLPFTLVQLHRILAGVIGWGNYEIKTFPGEPKLEVEIDLSERDASLSIYDLLKRIIPAHVLWKYSKTHTQESYKVKVKVAGQVERIIETQPEARTYSDSSNEYVYSANQIEVCIETGAIATEYKDNIISILNHAHIVETLIETRS